MKRFFSYFYNRKLRIDILSLFLTLLVVSLTIIALYSYIKNRNAIIELAKGTIDQVGLMIRERILSVVVELQQMSKLACF